MTDQLSTEEPSAGEGSSAGGERQLARSAAVMTVLTGVSRGTGLVRIVVVGAVLGDTFLGNTYQSTNAVPNLIFEVMAAGVFQAVLVPSLVRHLSQGKRDRAEQLAGSILGVSLVALSAVAVVGMLLSPWLAQGLFAGSDPAVRGEQVRLGTIFLLFFLPQVGMYAAGMVATGVLNADDRFGVPAIAPAVNNVIVTAAYGLFWWSRHGQEPSLDLTTMQIILLAGGTTAGVVGFCTLPLVAVRRIGFSLRIRRGWNDPEVRSVIRMGAWAAGFLVGTQMLLLVELVIANRVAGGVVAFQIGWTFFLLPYALFAQPVLTALFPRMSRQEAKADVDGFLASIRKGTELICLFVVPSAIAFLAIGPAASRAVLFGAIDREGAERVGMVVANFGPGVIGYGLLLFYARVFYARLDARTPTLVAAVAAVLGAISMIVAAPQVRSDLQVPMLAALHSATYLLSAAIMLVLLRGRIRGGSPLALFTTLRPQLIAVLPVAVVGIWAGRAIPLDSRFVALGGAVLVSGAIGAAYLLLTAVAGGPNPRQMLQALKGGG
ncbi:MAG: lipid II flippase MurJ [Aquihabitans sp.]